MAAQITSTSINWATPAPAIENPSAADTTRYFSLHENDLSGNYKVMGSSTPYWGGTLSDASGNINEVITFNFGSQVWLHNLTLTADATAGVIPVDYRVELKRGGTVLRTFPYTGNAASTRRMFTKPSYLVDSVVVTVTKLNRANVVNRFTLFGYTNDLKRDNTGYLSGDGYRIASTLGTADEALEAYTTRQLSRYRRTTTAGYLEASNGTRLYNVHEACKAYWRQFDAKVSVNYAGQFADDTVVQVTSSSNRLPGDPNNITRPNFVRVPDDIFYTNRSSLTGAYKAADASANYGWISSEECQADGTFTTPPWIQLEFSTRMISPCTIETGVVVAEAVIEITTAGGVKTETITGNATKQLQIKATYFAATKLKITIKKMVISGLMKSVIIANIPILSTTWYDKTELISIDLLEEMNYQDQLEALGGVSANRITITLMNDKAQFGSNAPAGFRDMLKKNRKIIPYLGVYLSEEEDSLEWHRLGTFWSYSWDVQDSLLNAKVVAMDNLWLLSGTTYENHQVFINQSMGKLAEAILTDAKRIYPDITFNIDASLYSITIPCAWFERNSHFAALNRLAGSGRVYIYCDREGCIQVAIRNALTGNSQVTISKHDSVISDSYPSLYADLPNDITVGVTALVETTMDVVKITTPFTVLANEVQYYVASNPIKGSATTTIDTTVANTVETFSWGIKVTYKAAGTINSITTNAVGIETKISQEIKCADATSIQVNGSNPASIKHDFIQTVDRARTLGNMVLQDSIDGAYDAEVVYRGDIALTTNQGVTFVEGIAPTHKYYVKRHTLYWSGSVSGTLRLNA